MRSNEEASRIVVGCIIDVSGVNSVDLGRTLATEQISTSSLVLDLVDDIVNHQIEVKVAGYKVSTSWLNGLTPKSKVSTVFDIVRNKPIPVDYAIFS
jgi:hypothetical protein